jgi:hypothetical protein
MTMMSDHVLLARIANLLDGTEWSAADTLERIAQLLVANGYRVREPEEGEYEREFDW